MFVKVAVEPIQIESGEVKGVANTLIVITYCMVDEHPKLLVAVKLTWYVPGAL